MRLRMSIRGRMLKSEKKSNIELRSMKNAAVTHSMKTENERKGA